jgi:hypothetical protein
MFNKKNSEVEDAEDYQESTDEATSYDMQGKPRVSDFVPEGYSDYRRYSNEPDAKTEFADLVNKDLVFANLDPLDKERLSFRIATVQLAKDIFVVRKDVQFQDKNGDIRTAKDVLVPDENFIPLINYLKIRISSEVNISRAIGKERAAVLDISSINKITKAISRKKDKLTGLE